MILRITAPAFVAGLVVHKSPWTDYSLVHETAPILSYMQGWKDTRVYAYAKKRGWKVERVDGSKANTVDR